MDIYRYIGEVCLSMGNDHYCF